jgi:hypothetical protein
MSTLISPHSTDARGIIIIRQAWWESIWRPNNRVLMEKEKVEVLFQDGQSGNKGTNDDIIVVGLYKRRVYRIDG